MKVNISRVLLVGLVGVFGLTNIYGYSEKIDLNKVCVYKGNEIGLSPKLGNYTYHISCDSQECIVWDHKGEEIIYFENTIRKKEKLDLCSNLKRVIKLYNK